MVHKSNNRINMPALDGRSGAPHPCMVSGERWTYAWPSLPRQAGDVEGDVRYSKKRMIICDNFHMNHAAKTQHVKIALGSLRKPWIGFQIYPKGGVRLIPEVPNAQGLLVAIHHIITHQQKYQIDYIRDRMDLPPGPEDIVPPPIASCAHRRLPYGCIVDDDFYAKLRDAMGA